MDIVFNNDILTKSSAHSWLWRPCVCMCVSAKEKDILFSKNAQTEVIWCNSRNRIGKRTQSFAGGTTFNPTLPNNLKAHFCLFRGPFRRFSGRERNVSAVDITSEHVTGLDKPHQSAEQQESNQSSLANPEENSLSSNSLYRD